MAITPTDESNLLLPLFEGIFEEPVWETFLRRLALRTGADRVRLTVQNSAAPNQTPMRRRVLADRLARQTDAGEPEAFDARIYSALRPNRVYLLDEIRDFDRPAERAAQTEALAAARVDDARLIRVSGRGDLHAWIVLLSERTVFGAADSALLTALAPAVATALELFAAIGGLRLRADTARDTLALLGIEQEILDHSGHPLGELARTGTFAPSPSQALSEACTALAEAPTDKRQLIHSDGRDLLLRPAGRSREGLSHPAAVIAMQRIGLRENASASEAVLARQFGLSACEAALAGSLSRGVPLIEAGRTLQLTPETTRNYSKRIYAKTGTSGQADLVRLVLNSLAPLA